MTQQELIVAVNTLIDDELPSPDINRWLNAALSDLGRSVNATFPKLNNDEPDTGPVIPEDWQELLVLFAASRAKEQDSSTVEADRFMAQYQMAKKDFISDYEVPEEWANPDPDADLMNESYLSTLQNPYGWTW